MVRTKEIDTQTILNGAQSMGNLSDGADQIVDHQTNVSTNINFTQGDINPNKPRVQSANRTTNGSLSNMMMASYGPSNTDLNKTPNILGIQRPTKSAANKYRNLIQGNAIQEESINEHQREQFLRTNNNTRTNLLSAGDDDSIQDGGCTAPIAMRIHKTGRRSHVRLKEPRDKELQNRTAHTVSQGAGVLIGNYGGENRLDETDLFLKREGQLKSVYDIRMSYTRPSSMPRGKRSLLKSAGTRQAAPCFTTENEPLISSGKMRPPVGPSSGLSKSKPMINTQLMNDSQSRNDVDSAL